MKVNVVWMKAGLVFLSGAIVSFGYAAKAKTLDSQIAIYQEEEKGIDKPYITRFIANERFLRIDEGNDKSGYVLYDREDRTIYSVVHENRTIMTVTSKPVLGKLPKELKVKTSKNVDKKMPKIGGQQPIHLVNQVNGKTCVNYVLVPHTLPQVVKAVMEYRSVLAGQHWLNLDKTPKDMRDPCHTAFNIFNNSNYLKIGLVVREWRKQKKRQLIDLKQHVAVKEALFKLPKQYRRFKTSF